MKRLALVCFLLPLVSLAQTFTHSGYIYTATGGEAQNVAVKLYRRTNSAITGFSSQTNYNGHSYYRSTTSAYWLNAKSACENMGGHLATVSNAAENSFIYNTWPSGWIGYYQDKNGAFYSEPNGGWRWTESYVETGQQANYDVASYTSGNTISDIRSSINGTLYNSPTLTTGGGKYLTFNGSTQYAITGNLASKFSGGSEVTTLILWAYPSDAGVLVNELGAGSSSSGWHESVIEITNVSGSSGTLRCGLWNGSGISQINTTVALNQWHMIAITYDGSTMKGYLDGNQFSSLTFNRDAPYNNGNGLYYGLGLGDATNMGDGTYSNYRLGAFQVYNTCLSSDEVNRSWMSLAYRFGRYPYSAWNGGEPNNSGGEDYIQFVGGGLWNDLPNGVSLPYVIEFDYIVTTSAWSLHQTKYTDANGYYSFSVSTDPSKEYYIEITATTPTTTLQTSDITSVLDVVLSKTALNGRHFYMYDLNGDNQISVSDAFQIAAKRSGLYSGFTNSFISRIYTSSQYNTINSSTSNLKSTIPGVSSITITNPVSGGTSNFYIFSPGYSGSVSY
jgi:hypothetical protein